MPYQVLALKYRPQNFDEVVGQEHVTTTLKNALAKNRLHHAYLFTGVRGTGKTSLARIFAKSLNCEKGPTPAPCNRCSHCESITKGNFLDVIEIDGASNTSVDSVRELREQVKYVPAAGRYKIYIIDEVHMLSTSAFNALLKTLEEPPAHVVFVFATTEVHKIPVTILSRCQRFDLRRLAESQIKERLREIGVKEGIRADAASLDLVARSAEGSMRDGLSLLDRAIGIGGEGLDVAKIQEMLGLADAVLIEDLTQDCLRGRLPEALAKADELYNRGFDLRQVGMQWVEYLHDLVLLKSAGADSLGSEISDDKLKLMADTIEGVGIEELQIAFQTVYRSSEEMFRSEAPKILFDLLLVKLVHGAPYRNLADSLATSARSSAPTRQGSDSSPGAASKDVRLRQTPLPTVSVQLGNAQDLLDRAVRKSPQIKALLDHALRKSWEGSTLVVGFQKGSIHSEMLAEKKSALAEALSRELGSAVKVEIRSEEINSPQPREASSGPVIPADPVVQQALEVLNARVQEIK